MKVATYPMGKRHIKRRTSLLTDDLTHKIYCYTNDVAQKVYCYTNDVTQTIHCSENDVTQKVYCYSNCVNNENQKKSASAVRFHTK